MRYDDDEDPEHTEKHVFADEMGLAFQVSRVLARNGARVEGDQTVYDGETYNDPMDAYAEVVDDKLESAETKALTLAEILGLDSNFMRGELDEVNYSNAYGVAEPGDPMTDGGYERNEDDRLALGELTKDGKELYRSMVEQGKVEKP